jgi:LPXTG-motif cell wall-anchored protein
VTVTLQSSVIVLGTATTDEHGDLTIVVTVPDGVPPGQHTVQLDGTGADGRPATVTASIVIAAPPTEAPTTTSPVTAATLPTTGADGLRLVTLALILVAAGALIVIVRRRSRFTE